MQNDPICEPLARIWAIHQFSLASYLAYAQPFWADGDERGSQLLQDVVRDQHAMADRFGKLMIEHHCNSSHGAYPMRFMTLNDLSSKFLWAELLRLQEQTITMIDELLQAFPVASICHAVAEESLGNAKAHLDSMRELVSDAFGLPA